MSIFRNILMHWKRRFGPYIVEVDGVYIDFRSISSSSVRSLLIKGYYERDERELLGKAVRCGDKVVELGAGIGLIGLISRRIVGTIGDVTSFEANPKLEPVILRNYSINAFTPKLVMKAVDVVGEGLNFRVSDDILGSSAENSDTLLSDRLDVPSVSLSEVVKTYRPNVIIMDVEGSEKSLLKCQSLDRVDRVLVEMHPRTLGRQLCDELETGMTDRGFSIVERVGDNILFERL